MAIQLSLKKLRFPFCLALGLSIAFPAAAVDLDQARKDGLVGERPDGLVGAVQASPHSDIQALVESVNTARMTEYRVIAQKNGSPIDAVQAIAGEKQIQRAKENKWYVLTSGGNWSR